jgi:hypothetical protein
MAYAYNPRTLETEVGSPQFKAILGCLYSKNFKKQRIKGKRIRSS